LGLAALGLAALVWASAGCGYRFSVATGRLPGGGTRLAIPPARHRGAEPWPAVHFTRALRAEAERAGLELVEAGAGGVPVLKARLGDALAVPRGVALYGGSYRAREQEVALKIELELEGDGPSPRRFSLSDRVSYLSAPDLRGTEANRQLALRRLLDRLARRAVERLARGF